ncbi:MAG: hypothetical protein MUQ25_06485 [Candidatus Aminicenantes bacterium]|nr:hypothetical protein [Candidatus Aminicenantes bacterium]
MEEKQGHPLKLKAIFISDDGGKTWMLVRQYYLTDVTTNRFLDDLLQGKRFGIINNGDSNGNNDDRATAL